MPRRKPPSRAGMYRFGPEIPPYEAKSPGEFKEKLIEARDRGVLGTKEHLLRVVAEAEEQAWAILKQTLGVERSEVYFKVGPEGAWRPIKEKDVPETIDRIFGICAVQRLPEEKFGRKPDGIQIWCFKLLKHVTEVRRAISEGDIYGASSIAYALGQLVMVGQFEFRHAKTVSAGVKSRAGAKLGGEMRRKKLARSTRAVLEAMDKRIKGEMSVSQAAKLTFERDNLGSSANANRQLWNCHRSSNTK